MFEQEQYALTRETLEDEQRNLIEKLWSGEYYHDGVPILQALGDVTIELARMHYEREVNRSRQE